MPVRRSSIHRSSFSKFCATSRSASIALISSSVVSSAGVLPSASCGHRSRVTLVVQQASGNESYGLLCMLPAIDRRGSPAAPPPLPGDTLMMSCAAKQPARIPRVQHAPCSTAATSRQLRVQLLPKVAFQAPHDLEPPRRTNSALCAAAWGREGAISEMMLTLKLASVLVSSRPAPWPWSCKVQASRGTTF